MNTKRIRMPLDILMTILSIILMGGTVLFPNDRVHQILGMTLLVLWAVHVILNRRWFGSLFKGRYAPHRIMQIVVNLGVLVCALLLMISGMMMAWFVPSEIVGGGLGFARTTHLLSSHWYYIFMPLSYGGFGNTCSCSNPSFSLTRNAATPSFSWTTSPSSCCLPLRCIMWRNL